jgi:Kef-type K+ transport system membrane component KefB
MPFLFFSASESAEILVALAIVLFSAKLLGEVFERLKQPAVVGEILAGVIIGPSVLALINPDFLGNGEIIPVLAEIGVIFLLFNVGLETKPQAILAVGMRAFVVAVLGVVVPFIAGFLIALAWDGSKIEAMFIGAALVATSVGITARVLGGMGLLDAPTARIILGAAVIDDILGLLILSVVSGMGKGNVDYVGLAELAGLASAFTIVVAVVGAIIMGRVAKVIGKMKIGNPVFNLGIVLCLALSFAASYVGVAAIIGAFLAGMALSEATEHDRKTHSLTSGITEFLVPFFLVNIGMQLDVSLFKDMSVVVLAIVITVVAVVTKYIGGTIAAYGLGWRRASQVGVGMIPRGEVGIIVAQIGVGMGLIEPRFFASVLFMAIATTLIAPPLIKIMFSTEPAAHGKVDSDDAGGIVVGSDDLHRIG